MVRKKKLFVSHSSHSKVAKDFLKTVCQGLAGGDDGFDVLVDQVEIPFGADWERYLNEWLAECHAAVILFSADSVQSWWVLKEATILTWRRELDEQFTVVPVLIGDMDSSALEQGPFKPLRIKASNYLRAATAEEVVSKSRQGLGPCVIHTTPLDLLRQEFIGLCRNLTREQLETACDRIGLYGPHGWRPNDQERFAEALARRLVREGQRGLNDVIEVIDVVHRHISKETAKNILDLVAPLWVDPEAACRIPCAASGPDATAIGGERLAVALNGQLLFDFTAPMYLDRAYHGSRDWMFTTVDAARIQVEEVYAAIRDDYRRRRPGRERLSEEQTDRLIRNFDRPYFVLLPETLTDAPLLSDLRRTYPNLTFILATGDELPDHDDLPPRVVPLIPPLQLDVESKQWEGYEHANDLLSNMYR